MAEITILEMNECCHTLWMEMELADNHNVCMISSQEEKMKQSRGFHLKRPTMPASAILSIHYNLPPKYACRENLYHLWHPQSSSSGRGADGVVLVLSRLNAHRPCNTGRSPTGVATANRLPRFLPFHAAICPCVLRNPSITFFHCFSSGFDPKL